MDRVKAVSRPPLFRLGRILYSIMQRLLIINCIDNHCYKDMILYLHITSRQYFSPAADNAISRSALVVLILDGN